MKNEFLKKECRNCKHCCKTTVVDKVAYSFSCNKNNDMVNFTLCEDFERKGKRNKNER